MCYLSFCVEIILCGNCFFEYIIVTNGTYFKIISYLYK